MQIVTSHTNTDFDALAAMVACTCLYPGTVGILPSHVMPGVKAFMAIHQDLLRIRPRKGFDLDEADRLIVVDTNQWGRLDRMTDLKKKGLDVICWDHHMTGTDIDSRETRREEVGATVTLILEEMERKQTPFTPMQATLFLLGIYDDTGCLTFSSATPRDARMTAFLLENGADLNLVSSYLSQTIDDPHSEVFSRMLANAEVIDKEGLSIGICALAVTSGLTQLAALVEKYKDFKGLDAVFGVFITDQDKVMVIGRSNPAGLDVGTTVRCLGGGGHPAAGAAVVKGEPLDQVVGRIKDLIQEAGQADPKVGEMMSGPENFTLLPDTPMEHAKAFMEKYGLNAAVIADNDMRLLGILPRIVVEKAEKNNRLNSPVKGGIKPQVQTLSPDDTARVAMNRMNQTPEGLLPVIASGRLEGVLTRGNLILHIYNI